MNKLFLSKTITIITCCFLSSTSLYAQNENQKKADKELYNSALELINKSNKALKNDDLIEAEKLYYQSLKTYPITNGSNSLALTKLEIGDNRGANKVWDNLIARLISHPQVLTEQSTDIGSFIKLSYRPSAEYIKMVRLVKATANFYKGDIRIAHEELMVLKKEGALDPANMATLGETSLQVGDYEITQEVIDELTKFYINNKNKTLLIGLGTQLTPTYLTAKLALAKGDFTNAVKFAEQLKESDRSDKHIWTVKANLINSEAQLGLGNIEKSKVYHEAAIKNIVYTKNSPEIAYVGGLIALAEKRYPEALERFNVNLSFKPSSFKYGTLYAQQITYTKKAEAYLGLNDLVNAKQNYESALLYFPNYEPALSGLAKLEGNQATIRKIDKTGPEIKISEPTITRGLKVVASGDNVMIKGIALDPSGLKSVTFNGQSVYSKEAGDFWGSITLTEGLNKIVVSAIDIAGNSTEQTFEIERPSSAVVVPVEPVSKEKIGKNYAVFIASQNYDDSAIPSLENPISDAIKLKLILKNNYNFSPENIYTLFNPQRSDFAKKFLELKEAIQPEDNLVIFYAGHGVWVEKEKKGYWLLTDALRNDVNTWVPNKEVLDMIAELPARHTLLITDACFSGSVFKSRGIGADAPVAMKEIDNKISRVAITSGNDTEVPDVSVFMKYLIKALSENKDKYLTAQKMFVTQIIEAVMTESKTEPRYGTLELAGHVGGDFIFSKK